MTAAILAACGCWVGRVRSSQDVKKCSYENIVVEGLMRKAQVAMGLNPDSHSHLPERAAELPLCVWLEGHITREFQYQGWRGEPWMVKSSALAFVWPIWNRSWPNAKWVVVRRDTVGLVRSVMSTWSMTGRSGAEAWMEWAEWHDRELSRLESEVKYAHELWPTKFCSQGDFREVQMLVETVGLKWNAEAVRELFKKT